MKTNLEQETVRILYSFVTPSLTRTPVSNGEMMPESKQNNKVSCEIKERKYKPGMVAKVFETPIKIDAY